MLWLDTCLCAEASRARASPRSGREATSLASSIARHAGVAMHPLKFRPDPLAEIARKNRQEILRSGLRRRELFKLGLLTSTGGLVRTRGLSAQVICDPGGCHLGCSPPTIPFVDPLPIPAVLPQRALTDPGFAIPPNRAQPSGQPQDARDEPHQFFDQFPPQQFL